MWQVCQRLSELWYKQKRRPLTSDEQQEFSICMDAMMNKALRLARLENLSYAASIVNDTEEQLKICSEIEKIKAEMADVPYLR